GAAAPARRPVDHAVRALRDHRRHAGGVPVLARAVEDSAARFDPGPKSAVDADARRRVADRAGPQSALRRRLAQPGVHATHAAARTLASGGPARAMARADLR